jgi:hypothetical protein
MFSRMSKSMSRKGKEPYKFRCAPPRPIT